MEGMCGRFAITTGPARLAEQIRAVDETGAAGADFTANYNVAPTTPIATVVARHAEPGDAPTRRVRLMRWGLIPPWTRPGPDDAPDPHARLLINARADKVTESPAYRGSAAHRRCLVPMDGFYEWRVNPAPAAGRGRKTPFYIHRADGATLFAAGLWSVWRPHPQAPALLSTTIVTTDAVGALAGVHDRMPLLVTPADFDRWLDPDAPADPTLLARPPAVDALALREVSTLVNAVRNNGPELIAAAAEAPGQQTLL